VQVESIIEGPTYQCISPSVSDLSVLGLSFNWYASYILLVFAIHKIILYYVDMTVFHMVTHFF